MDNLLPQSPDPVSRQKSLQQARSERSRLSEIPIGKNDFNFYARKKTVISLLKLLKKRLEQCSRRMRANFAQEDMSPVHTQWYPHLIHMDCSQSYAFEAKTSPSLIKLWHCGITGRSMKLKLSLKRLSLRYRTRLCTTYSEGFFSLTIEKILRNFELWEIWLFEIILFRESQNSYWIVKLKNKEILRIGVSFPLMRFNARKFVRACRQRMEV